MITYILATLLLVTSPPSPIFADGFESGAVDAWTVPDWQTCSTSATVELSPSTTIPLPCRTMHVLALKTTASRWLWLPDPVARDGADVKVCAPDGVQFTRLGLQISYQGRLFGGISSDHPDWRLVASGGLWYLQRDATACPQLASPGE